MALEFLYQGQPSRVIFGAGSLSRLAEEVDHLGARKALVLSTPEQAEQAQAIADHSAVGLRISSPRR